MERKRRNWKNWALIFKIFWKKFKFIEKNKKKKNIYINIYIYIAYFIYLLLINFNIYFDKFS